MNTRPLIQTALLLGLVSSTTLAAPLRTAFTDQGNVDNSTMPLPDLFNDRVFRGMPDCVPPPAGLVSWWAGDGSASDGVGTNHGTPKNGVAFASGQVREALRLDGTGAYVEVGNPPNLRFSGSAPFSIICWVNPDAAGVIISKFNSHVEGEWSLSVQSDGRVCFVREVAPFSLVSSNAVPFGQFSHIAASYDGSMMRLFLNGQLDASDARGPSWSADNTPVLIGAYYDNGQPAALFTGLIDELAVFSRALSSNEIATIYAAGNAGMCRPPCVSPPSGVVGWWPGDGTAEDLVGGHHASLKNGATFTSGMVASTFRLDGQNGYAEVASAPALNFGTNDFTAVVWFYVDPGALVAQREYGIINKSAAFQASPGWGMEISTWDVHPNFSAKIYITSQALWCDACASSALLSPGTWYHLAGLRRGTNAELYVNGQLAERRGHPSVALNVDNVQPLELGRHSWGPTFPGWLDEISLFNRALASNEIAAIYAAGSAGMCKLECLPPPSGLVAWWPLEHSLTDAIQSLAPLQTQAIAFVQGRVGQGLQFGTGGVLDFPHHPSLTDQQFTWTAWVRPDGPGPNNDAWGNAVICRGTSDGTLYYMLAWRAANSRFMFECGRQNQSEVYSAHTWPPGTFYHVAATWDGQTARLFVNGQWEGERALAGPIQYDLGIPWALGCNASNYRAEGYPRTWNGVIDEVAFFNRALASNEIAALYAAGSAGMCQPQPEVPPAIVAQPTNQTVFATMTATFAVTATGSIPLCYLWRFNGTNLLGETNATLVLGNVQSSQAGEYSVVVSNAFGTITSSNALLTVRTDIPDLAVGGVAVPVSAQMGQAVPLVFTLTNAGTAPAPSPWLNTVWLASDAAGAGAQSLGTLGSYNPLPAGASVTLTQTVILSAGVFGPRFIGVQADSAQQLFEWTETNNTAYAPLPIQILAPDLAPSLLASPTVAQFGETISVSWAVTNLGSAPAGAVWSDRLYLAVRSNDLSGATLLATAPAGLIPLAPDAGYTTPHAVTLPLSATLPPGSYFLVVVADVNNSQLESNEANNTASQTIQLTWPPLPDLVVTNLIVPDEALPGQTVWLSWTVTNQGAAGVSGTWSETVSASSDDLIGNDALVATFSFTHTLPPGAALVRTQAITIPALGLSGHLRFVVAVDTSQAITEENETDNAAIAGSLTHVPASLTLYLPVTAIAENASQPMLQALVSRNGSLAEALVVSITSSDTNELAAPASVTIQPGQASAAFPSTVRRDNVADGDQQVVIAAAASGYNGASAVITVLNSDWPRLSLQIAEPTVTEGNTVTATVSREATTGQPLGVTLGSSSSANLTPPASVTIPADTNAVTFALLAVDDTVIEPSRTYTVTASAPGHAGASADVTVADNDWPILTLALSRTNASEGDGAQAAFATLRRHPASHRALVVAFRSSDPTAAVVPATATLPAFAEEATFPVATADDAFMDGPQDTVISAQATATGEAGVLVGEPVSQTLTVSDDDGPTLKVVIAKKLVAEGLSPATTAQVSRNTPPTNDLVVALESSDTTEATVPATVTIATGHSNATFRIDSTADLLTDGSQPVTISAHAPDYTEGSDTLVVTDINLPDLVVARVTVPPGGLTEEYVNLTFRVENQGLAASTNAFRQRIFLSPDPYVGNDVLLGQYDFGGGLPVGQHFEQSVQVRLPRAAGDYWVVVAADVDHNVSENQEANNVRVSAAAIQVSSEYAATVQTDLTTALAGTPVPLYGTATLARGGSAAFKLVNLHLQVRGITRLLAALTDADGRFTATFQPLPGEAGHYTIGAAHPGQASAPVQDEFTLLGMRLNPDRLNLRVVEGGTASGSVTVQNLSEVPLSGLTATVSNVAASLQVTAQLGGAGTLPGGGEVTLSCAVTARDASILQSGMTIHVTSAEGPALQLPVMVTVEPLRARLAATPGELIAGMTRGRQTIVEFSVSNPGGLATGPLAVLVPALPWLRVASTNPLPSLAPGETGRVTLLLAPAADLPLAAYTGTLGVQGSSVGLTIPYNFRALSEARGDLQVTVVDEYTFFAEGAPRLANAAVNLSDALTHSAVTNGTTDNQGEFHLPQIPEGYYDLTVTAERHTSFRATVLVVAGRTNSVEAFLSRQTVHYTWTVVPTEIEDRTRITIETVFETFVPMPVVTVEPMIIDLAEMTQPGQVMALDLKLSNHGLIAAQNVRVSFAPLPLFDFNLLVEQVGTLPANSSLSVPLTITRRAQPRELRGAKSASQSSASTSCTGSGAVSWSYPCGGNQVNNQTAVAVVNGGQNCGGGDPWGSGVAWGAIVIESQGACVGCAVVSSNVVTPTVSSPVDCSCLPTLGLAAAQCAISLMDFGNVGNCVVSVGLCGLSVYQLITNTQPPSVMDPNAASSCLSAVLDCLVAAGATVTGYDVILDIIGCGVGLSTACPDPAGGGGSGGESAGVVAKGESGPIPEPGEPWPYRNELRGSVGRCRALLEAFDSLFADAEWFPRERDANFNLWMGALLQAIHTNSAAGARISDEERAGLLGPPYSTWPTHTNLFRFIERWNRSWNYWTNGIYLLSQVPAGQDTNFFAFDVLATQLSKAREAILLSQAAGFTDPVAEFREQQRLTQLWLMTQGAMPKAAGGAVAGTEPKAMQPKSGGGGVCAQVRLRVEQEAVIARDAFNATLELLNNGATPLLEVRVDLVIKDSQGRVGTSQFGIRPPVLTGMSAVDGTGLVDANSSGTASWILIPSADAAPTETTTYWVGGTLGYVQDGVRISVPLSPAPIRVLPNPRLRVEYFHQRDVFSDDPFTPGIEPSLPFSLAVMVQNQGHGAARNMRITSAQPTIIENEKGLLIDFAIIATEVAGRSLSPSLTANLGDIDAGQIAIARWLMTSTLQGLFTEYHATFEHLDGLGNPRLSLIESVEIHEMIRLVQAAGAFEDARPDFLVNDVPDANDRPDTLYLSDGTVQPVSAVETGSADGAPTSGDLEVQLVAPMPSGWVYLRVPEPSDGQMRLARVVRSDGVEMPLHTNVWTTDRTFIGLGRRPIREHILHLLDHDSTGRYSLLYAVPLAPDTNAPSSRVDALPASSYAEIPLSWAGEDESSGSGLAGFDIFVSVAGGPFVPWLQRTTLRSALYPGELGSRYAFYSVATDAAGNREAAPLAPDAETAVTLTNTPPSLASGGVFAFDEGETVSVLFTASDSDVPAQTLAFSLGPGVPPGATLNPLTGWLTWPTGEADGPSTNRFTAIVRDNGTPALSATTTVAVVVNEVNTPPLLTPPPSFTVSEGQLVTFTHRSTDVDLPGQTLTFRLGLGVPAGASVTPDSGVFTWRPAEFQGGTTNRLALLVTDSGEPALSATQMFTVIVRDTRPDFALSLGTTNLLAGESSHVPLYLNAGAALTNVTFRLETDFGRLTNLALVLLAPDVQRADQRYLSSNCLELQFHSHAGSVLQGQFDLAHLAFEALRAERSAIVSLRAFALAGLHDGTPPALCGAASSGRVFVLEREPILDALPTTNGQHRLMLYGHAGRRYALEATTNLLVSGSWSEVRVVQLEAMRDLLGPFSTGTAAVFYRVRELPALGLSIRQQNGAVIVSWPNAGSDWRFAFATNLVATGTNTWTLIPPPSPTNATDCVVTEPAPVGNKFYRLYKP